MKYYLLAMHQPVGDPPAPEVMEPIMRDLAAVREEMKAAGAWVFGGGLHGPEASTVVRARGGDVLVTDGPYAEGKEHLGGFVVIKAPDLDAALGWARKEAEAVRLLPIEVRPFQGGAGDLPGAAVAVALGGDRAALLADQVRPADGVAALLVR
ncbi:MAG TPA: YciI family protein [Trebonia sp.]|jgi:hypothetical protein